MGGERGAGIQQFLELVRTGHGTDGLDEGDRNEVVLVFLHDAEIAVTELAEPLPVFGHLGCLLLLGKGGQFLNEGIVLPIHRIGLEVGLRHAVIEVGAGERVVGKVHLHGLAVVEEQEGPVGA